MESLRSSGDFRELLSLFNAEGVRYLIIGGFALAHYGRPRYTKDLDIWVGVNFSNAWEARQRSAYADIPVFVISRDDYIANKRASGRPSDLRDVAALLEDEA
jgi:hypothetical protein